MQTGRDPLARDERAGPSFGTIRLRFSHFVRNSAHGLRSASELRPLKKESRMVSRAQPRDIQGEAKGSHYNQAPLCLIFLFLAVPDPLSYRMIKFQNVLYLWYDARKEWIYDHGGCRCNGTRCYANRDGDNFVSGHHEEKQRYVPYARHESVYESAG